MTFFKAIAATLGVFTAIILIVVICTFCGALFTH
jgi:hypothetical protein